MSLKLVPFLMSKENCGGCGDDDSNFAWAQYKSNENDCAIKSKIAKLSLHINNSQLWQYTFFVTCSY